MPKKLALDRRKGMCKWIHDVFGESTITILWLTGDIMADFGNKRFFILYGPGNVGKSSVLSIICQIH